MNIRGIINELEYLQSKTRGYEGDAYENDNESYNLFEDIANDLDGIMSELEDILDTLDSVDNELQSVLWY